MGSNSVSVSVADGVTLSNSAPLTVIAGLNVLESHDETLRVAEHMAEECRRRGMPMIFKASFDKANRSSIRSYRGVGMDRGLEILRAVKDGLGLPVLTDVHEPEQANPVAEVVDVLQLPAFLARQTDLVAAIASTGRVVNVKKPQYMSPDQVQHVADKVREGGNHRILICERGTQFGYDNLVVDMLGFSEMARQTGGLPIVFDVTHSLQRRDPGAEASGGRRAQLRELLRAGVAVGIASVFVEAHRNPDKAPCDGPSAIPLHQFGGVIEEARRIDDVVKNLDSPVGDENDSALID